MMFLLQSDASATAVPLPRAGDVIRDSMAAGVCMLHYKTHSSSLDQRPASSQT